MIAFLMVASAKADTVVDLGTVALATNVNASIYNATYSSFGQTYTYNQLLQNPSNATDGIILDNGKTIDQECQLSSYVGLST